MSEPAKSKSSRQSNPWVSTHSPSTSFALSRVRGALRIVGGDAADYDVLRPTLTKIQAKHGVSSVVIDSMLNVDAEFVAFLKLGCPDKKLYSVTIMNAPYLDSGSAWAMIDVNHNTQNWIFVNCCQLETMRRESWNDTMLDNLRLDDSYIIRISHDSSEPTTDLDDDDIDRVVRREAGVRGVDTHWRLSALM